MYKKRAASLALAVLVVLTSVLDVEAEETRNGETTFGEKKTAEDVMDNRENVRAESDAEADEDTEEITSLEDANKTMAAYEEETAQWEEIYIDSVEDMKEFARNCWLDTWSMDKKVYLTSDINLSGSDFVSIPTFGGYFDGQGHTISGLMIRESVSYTGLFCYTQRSAVITDVTVQGSVCPGGKPMVVGGLVGDNSGILLGCNFYGMVEGNDYVGGITGFNEQSGILIDCTSSGTVTGVHYTGGIAGENTGNIAGCSNEADVNIFSEDKPMSLEDINLEQYTAGLLDMESEKERPRQASAVNNTIDTGGIAGLSTGIIQYCSNRGTVGYEHVGYNTGGIVGRQSGYVYACENEGSVYGRKDVGGIAGQTEPYIAIDLSEDIAYQLSENIDKLHDLTSRMLEDAGAESDTVSARLTVIQDFVDKALEDTGFLADRTIEWTDGMIGSANDLMGRMDYVMDEAGKDGGFADQTQNAAGNVRDAAEEFGDTLEALDLYQYMSEEERTRYEEARKALDSASEQYAKDYAKVLEAYRHYYIDKVRSDPAYGYTRNEGFSLYVCVEPSKEDAGADLGGGKAGKRPKGQESIAIASEQSGKEPAEDTTGNDADRNPGDGNIDDSVSGSGNQTGNETGSSTAEDEKHNDSSNNENPEDSNAGTGIETGKNQNDGSVENNDTESDTLIEGAAKEEGTGSDNEINGNDTRDTEQVNERDLRPCFGEDVRTDWTGWNTGRTYEDYMEVTGWVHYHVDADGAENQTAFPQKAGAQGELDRKLLTDVSKEMTEASNAARIEADAAAYADEKYKAAHPSSAGYHQDMKDYLQIMSELALKAGAKMSKEARGRLESAVGLVEDAMGNLESAGSEVRNIFHTVNGMPDLQLPELGSDYRSKANSLNANLQGLSENMGQLNDEMSSTNDVMLADLADINDQFSVIMRLYTDAIDGVLDMDYTAIYEDNSQADAENSTDATIADCTNRGIVRGDLNVAGVTGTMAIEYDFDLEGDVTGIENARWNSTFLTKCILRHNINEGNVTAQKSYVGGIAGQQEMGTILRCENYGRINSTTGNYVGGIAGKSLSYIVNGYAKCTVSGEEYVAGISGSGSSMENCCAMVRVQDASAFYGAIAGETDSSGTVADNYFVSEEIAGIDRISYSGKAEPVSYEELLAIEGLPNRFHMMSVIFYADEEEVKRIECPYMSNVTSDWYPDIPAKDGFYADWDIKEIPGIMYDEDITAEYVCYLTTLASRQTRENGQSVLLVDGLFKQEEEIQVIGGNVAGSGAAASSQTTEKARDDVADPAGNLLVGGIEMEKAAVTGEEYLAEEIPLKNVVERWHITIPEDVNAQHQLRYQASQGQTEDVILYIKQGERWVQAATELMGIYHLFTVEGTEAEIAVCIQDSSMRAYLLYLIPVLAAGAILLLYRRKKRKMRE